jgi:hypothetical protein
MNIQAIATLTRNEIWSHINEFQLPVKKYPSTTAARAALAAYYEELPKKTVKVAAKLLVTPVAQEEFAVKTSFSGAAVAVVLLTFAGAFLRVLFVGLIVATMLLTKTAAGLPATLQKLRAAASQPELQPVSQIGLA